MKNIKYIILIFSTFFLGCEKNFNEINADLDNPVTIPAEQIIGTVVTGFGNTMYSTFYGVENGTTWSQQTAMIQYNDPERYKPRVSSLDAVWNNFYLYASNAKQMGILAEAEGNESAQGIALVLKAYSFSMLTDIYGDIPYSEALLASEGITTPVYDKQEDVYTGILADLDTAITLLNSGNGSISASFDVLYGGDISKWNKFAHSLKFRCLMRISGKKDVSAKLQGLVNSGNLFESVDDEAKLAYLGASPNANPFFETIVEQGREEHKSAKAMIDILQENSDPRLTAYAQEAVNGGYLGKPAGFSDLPLAGFGYDDVSDLGEAYLKPEAPAYFVSYSELLFLLAEATHEGYISGGEAKAQKYYEDGINNSFTENGVSSDSYLNSSFAGYDSAKATEQINTQKWIALFGQGFESWTEWRRTKYPVLQPATEGYISEIPSRFKYQSEEVSLNKVNYTAAVSAQGPDELTTKVWWMN